MLVVFPSFTCLPREITAWQLLLRTLLKSPSYLLTKIHKRIIFGTIEFQLLNFKMNCLSEVINYITWIIF